MCESEDMDATQVAKELVRAWRGRRSQRGFSLRLGYASNVVNAWEAGRRWPTAATALGVARKAGIDLDEALRRFYRAPPAWVGRVDPASKDGVIALLADLRGRTPIGTIAERAGASRFAVSRWLRGRAEPQLPELLALVEAASGRALDLAAVLARRPLPSVLAARETVSARMAMARQDPWASVVLSCLCLHTYGETPAHDDAWVAARLGTDPETVADAIATLSAAGLVRREGRHWDTTPLFAQDVVGDPDAMRRLKAHWAREGLARMPGGPQDLFSTNFFTASERDVARLRELHVAYFRAVREVVETSTGPLDRVLVVNTQLFALGPT
jgi:transcriptional regulator with XRE-family HTH domain